MNIHSHLMYMLTNFSVIIQIIIVIDPCRRNQSSKPPMPQSLQPLPTRNQPWSSNINDAFQILSDIYRTTRNVLAQENYSIHRLRFHAETVANDAVPLLFTLEEAAEQEGLPVSWVHDVGAQYEVLIIELAEAERTALGTYV